MTKRQEMREKRQQQQAKQRTIAISVIAVGALIVAALLIIPNLGKSATKSVARADVSGNSMGKPDAPVKVEEFSDFQCPYCRIFAEQFEPKLVKEYVETGKVYFTYTPYSFIGAESVRAAEAAYCASDQGKFWDYYDTLFANQTGENVGAFADGKLVGFATTLSLNMEQFNDCFTNGKYKDLVKENVTYGQSKGIQGTPSFLVNGKLVMADKVFEAIDAALK